MRELIVIFGPTASGKSELARRLATRLGGEIIACDAVMVFRGFELGSNKPSPAERLAIPHHLLDVAKPEQLFTAADYARLARAAVDDLIRRGRPPIMVVGTYLYFRAFMYGLAELPPADATLRAEFAERERLTPGWLASEVATVDPESFQEAHGKNQPRLVRALEVYRLTGVAASMLRRQHGFAEPSYRAHLLGLNPPVTALRSRINQRAQAMVQAGLLNEVRELRRAGVEGHLRPMQAIGYKEANAVLDGRLPEHDLPEAIAQATRSYAKRQRTFFRKQAGIVWQETFGELASAIIGGTGRRQ